MDSRVILLSIVDSSSLVEFLKSGLQEIDGADILQDTAQMPA